jgi:hypothetical protein
VGGDRGAPRQGGPATDIAGTGAIVADAPKTGTVKRVRKIATPAAPAAGEPPKGE